MLSVLCPLQVELFITDNLLTSLPEGMSGLRKLVKLQVMTRPGRGEQRVHVMELTFPGRPTGSLMLCASIFSTAELPVLRGGHSRGACQRQALHRGRSAQDRASCI